MELRPEISASGSVMFEPEKLGFESRGTAVSEAYRLTKNVIIHWYSMVSSLYMMAVTNPSNKVNL